MKPRYTASRGGHAPGFLRGALCGAFDVSFWELNQKPWYKRLEGEEIIFFYDPRQQEWWDSLTFKERGRWLTGQLWNCTDIMPSSLCADLDLSPGSTYAMGVRKLRADLD